MRVTSGLVVLIVAVGPAGCGGDAQSDGQEAAVEDAATRVVDAIQEEDIDALCNLVATNVRLPPGAGLECSELGSGPNPFKGTSELYKEDPELKAFVDGEYARVATIPPEVRELSKEEDVLDARAYSERLGLVFHLEDGQWRFVADAGTTNAVAKSDVLAAVDAIESFADQNGDSYSGAEPETLAEEEPVLEGSSLSVPSTDGEGYMITVRSMSGATFSIDATEGGTVSYPCEPVDTNECPGDLDDPVGEWDPESALTWPDE